MLISEEDMFKDNYDLDGGEIEYTGNEGCSKEYTYRKTAIVICSKSYEGGHFIYISLVCYLYQCECQEPKATSLWRGKVLLRGFGGGSIMIFTFIVRM